MVKLSVKEVYRRLCRMARRGSTFSDVGLSRYEARRFFQNQPLPIDEGIRFLPHQRDCRFKHITFIYDITNVKLLRNKAKKFWNGHKKMHSLKYLVTTTAQGCPIFLSRSFPGRRNDSVVLGDRIPLCRHYANDHGLCDGGFRANKHATKPVRKPRLRALRWTDSIRNRWISKIRSRIERYFGRLKKKWKIMRETSLTPKWHEQFARLCIFCDFHLKKNQSPYLCSQSKKVPSGECFCDKRR